MQTETIYDLRTSTGGKRSLSRPKFFFENLFPSCTLSYTITKKPKRVDLGAKVIEGPEAPEDIH